MPKKNQIPYFHPVPRPNGAFYYHWKPTRRLRALGYTNLKLPDDYKAAVQAAIEQNERVAAGYRQSVEHAASRPPAPAQVETFVTASRAWQRANDTRVKIGTLKARTLENYNSYMRQLEQWAVDETGKSIPIAELTRQQLIDLRDILNDDDRDHRRVAMMATLNAFLQFCEDKGWISTHPGRNLRTRGAATRRHRLLREHLELIRAAATDRMLPHVATGCVLGFYTMQRQADLLATTAFTTRRIEDISSDARRALAGSDGHVLGMVLEQGKTGAHVAIPLVPDARKAVDAVLRIARAGAVRGTHIIRSPEHEGACPSWRFQRDFREVVNLAAQRIRDRALEARDFQRIDEANELDALADFIAATQFRDLRRSGMCWMRDLGVPVPLIAAISGHSIEQTQKILDTYMPRDTRAAAEGMAMAVLRQAERDAADKEEQG